MVFGGNPLCLGSLQLILSVDTGLCKSVPKTYLCIELVNQKLVFSPKTSGIFHVHCELRNCEDCVQMNLAQLDSS